MPAPVPRSPAHEVIEPPKILVVDDSAAVRAQMEKLLKDGLGATIRVAADGARALKLALEGGFDCVVCDINMPIMDGMTFLRALRAHYTRFELPLLFLTGTQDEAQTVRGFRAGASDFLRKTCPPEEVLARVQTHVELAGMHRRLTRAANTDALTGLFNRRLLFENLNAAFALHRRKGMLLSMLMLDVDHFKNINDTHGHPCGDAVLCSIAEVLRTTPRAYDVAARIGGEEFAVLCPDSSATDAAVLAERIRKNVANNAMGGLEVGAVSVSIGIAEGPHGMDNSEALLSHADERLYVAKRSGRNRVVLPEQVSATDAPSARG